MTLDCDASAKSSQCDLSCELARLTRERVSAFDRIGFDRSRDTLRLIARRVIARAGVKRLPCTCLCCAFPCFETGCNRPPGAPLKPLTSDILRIHKLPLLRRSSRRSFRSSRTRQLARLEHDARPSPRLLRTTAWNGCEGLFSKLR